MVYFIFNHRLLHGPKLPPTSQRHTKVEELQPYRIRRHTPQFRLTENKLRNLFVLDNHARSNLRVQEMTDAGAERTLDFSCASGVPRKQNHEVEHQPRRRKLKVTGYTTSSGRAPTPEGGN
jgi:hypothetical protein